MRGKNAIEEWLMCLYGERKLHSWKGGVRIGVFGSIDYNQNDEESAATSHSIKLGANRNEQ